MKYFILLLGIIFSLCSGAISRRVVCYFPDWAGYRQGDGKFTPNEMDSSKCTNILYSFAALNTDSVNIKPPSPSAQLYTDFVKKTKAGGAKPSLSLGGWSDSSGNQYSVLFNDASKRTLFVKNTVAYLEKYGFEGLDIDVEYPTCPQGDCSKGNPKDKEGYAELIKELSQAFKPKGWVLSAAISAEPGMIDRAYDINAMNKYFDWIGVMTYDYHTASEKETGPVSPLRKGKDDKFPNSNTENTMNHLISKGADKNKLMIGIPFYGYSYKLQSQSKNGYWSPTVGKGVVGPYTKDSSTGSVAYYEVCDFIKKQGFVNVENNDLGAYIYKGDNWISYNSQKDVENKMNYIKSSNLGGVIIWDISMDDFTGKFCGSGKNPLLSTIKSNIG